MFRESSTHTHVVPQGHDYYIEAATTPPTPPSSTPPTPPGALSGSSETLQQLLYRHPAEDAKISAVKTWVTQLIRKELGPALDKVDKRRKLDLFTHGIDFVQADLITKALMLKARNKTAASKPTRKKTRHGSRRA